MPVIVAAVVVAAVLLAGVVCALLFAAAAPLSHLLSLALHKIPVIGGWVDSAVQKGFEGVSASTLSWFDDNVHGLGQAIFGVGTAIHWLAYQQVQAHETHISNAVNGLHTTQNYYNAAISATQISELAAQEFALSIQRQEAAALSAAAGAALSTTQNYYNLAIQATNQAEARQLATTQNYYNLAIAHANGLAAAALTTTEDYYNLAIAHADALGGAALTTTENYYNAAIAATAAAEAQAKAFANQVAATVSGGAIAGLNEDVHDVVIGPWETLLEQTQAIAQSIPTTIAQQLGLTGTQSQAVPTTIAGVLAVTVPAVAAIATEVAECGVPLCKNLSGLGNFFSNLTDDVMLGLLLAFLVEAAHHPAGAASELEGDLGSIARDAADGFKDLVGI